MQALSKQKLRIKETRALLLDAANSIFVRDGYERAQLDEIAATAGRSKGAVYTHFNSKEDLFLSLFEHRTRAYVERLVASVIKCKSRKQGLRAFREFYVEIVRDADWAILTLEFKLFALRRPELRERFRKVFEMSKEPNGSAKEKEHFNQLTRLDKADAELIRVALGPVVSCLMLESYFEPEALSEEGLKRILGRIFDALIPNSVGGAVRRKAS
jgi:AcrR family transcriptional regulator